MTVYCDACGKATDERQLIEAEVDMLEIAYICHTCESSYDEDELVEKLEEMGFTPTQRGGT